MVSPHDPDEQVYLNAALAMVPFGDDDERLFEYHSCVDRPNCTPPCACSGVPWPSPAVRAAVDTAWRAGRTSARREIVELLRLVAEGRREYAKPHDGTDGAGAQVAAFIRAEASDFDTAANIAEGSLLPLYGLLPSWRWTDEMNAAADLASDKEAGDAAL